MICEALAKNGLVNRCAPMLHRIQAVQKAATSTVPRTVSRHRETMEIVQAELIDVPKIVIVDDVVTSGDTLFAAVEIVQDFCPNTEVRAFAVVRRVDEIPDNPHQCLAPCSGVITLRQDGRTIREP